MTLPDVLPLKRKVVPDWKSTVSALRLTFPLVVVEVPVCKVIAPDVAETVFPVVTVKPPETNADDGVPVAKLIAPELPSDEVPVENDMVPL